MRVDLFDFELPDDLIAQRPVSPRDSARLLDVAPDGLHDCTVRELPALLRRGDLLVFNDTKVIPARLKGVRPGGAGRQDVAVEALLIRDLGSAHWLCFGRPVKRLKRGDVIAFAGGIGAKVETLNADGSIVLVFDRSGHDFLTALESSGAVPLPPYIRGGVADAHDRTDYQTLFARVDGSVAAPTAGLHFTPALMAALAEAGIGATNVTLHVGAGTFQPVRVEDTDQHKMHAEWGEVPESTAQAIGRTRQAGGRVVSIGTTALRLLETVARDQEGAIRAWSGETDIFITPGFRFRAVDLLLTNFHLPRSTLFMLVAAFAGLERIKAAYAHAIAHRYRFYSYGDCCLLHR
ncbi:S-adenosylmethionine:tRNA ribosyltransferase-isomerase [Enhydrobacter aerosaccus]|uniref:S-adenosylmethionine:tRNA ribosyltransferase-isomerase n=1 Tax=Enhydrobacter aerosaccus TaxID=225324 RepID=A0A1T4S8E3_9HYPH|nr:tRNA preQ1(34) S-adenosylmethionine ribosyltransferase-isomerase QueA [Enhydrobacter aerosaccus]SKA24121.1 S-adenosylmethionine:tRNA ribosyltransferase-isomerase [Enhydrobacter aerosaccus]